MRFVLFALALTIAWLPVPARAAAFAPGTAFDTLGNPLRNVMVTVTFTNEHLAVTELGIPSGRPVLNATVQPGIVPIKEPGVAFDPNDSSTWSDFIRFANLPGPVFIGGTVDGLSDGITFNKTFKATDPNVFIATEDDANNTFTYNVPGLPHGVTQTYVFRESGRELEDVPEPSSFLLLASGIGFIGSSCAARRRASRNN